MEEDWGLVIQSLNKQFRNEEIDLGALENEKAAGMVIGRPTIICRRARQKTLKIKFEQDKFVSSDDLSSQRRSTYLL